MDIFYQKTTCSSSLLQPSRKAFAGPSGPQTLAVYPPAALPLPVYECSSFGKSFLLDIRESKNQGAPLPLWTTLRLVGSWRLYCHTSLLTKPFCRRVAGPDTLFHPGKDFQHGAFRKLEGQTPALGSSAGH